jgi:glutaminyl-peptide cyclotransferase
MRKLGLLESDPRSNFLSDATKTIVSHALRILARFFLKDDHIPFLLRGVGILHLIPIPFPSTWHTLQDDGEHLHGPTVRDWSKILTAFTMEWMDLEEVAVAAALKTKPPIDRTEL